MSDSQTEFKKLPKMMNCPYHHCAPTYMSHKLSSNIEHSYYCESCHKDNPTPGKFNAFGYGFYSQYTKSVALAN